MACAEHDRVTSTVEPDFFECDGAEPPIQNHFAKTSSSVDALLRAAQVSPPLALPPRLRRPGVSIWRLARSSRESDASRKPSNRSLLSRYVLCGPRCDRRSTDPSGVDGRGGAARPTLARICNDTGEELVPRRSCGICAGSGSGRSMRTCWLVRVRLVW